MNAAPRRRRWRRVLLGLLAFVVVLLLAGLVVVRRWAHQRTPTGTTVSQAERDKENTRVASLGVQVPDGGIVLEHPYELPFTGRSLVVPPSWLTPAAKLIIAPGTPRASDVLEDVKLLEQIVPRQYGGYDWAASRGFDWGSFFTGWREALAKRGDETLNVDEAFAPMLELSRQQLDNHTQIPLMLDGARSLSRSFALAHEASATCTKVRTKDGAERMLTAGDPGEQPRRALRPSTDRSKLEPASYLSLPERAGELSAISCGAEWIDLSPLAPKSASLAAQFFDAATTRPEVKRLDATTIWFRLPSMDPDTYRNLDELRKSWPSPDGKEQLLIVDVRGNGGGSSELGWDVLKGFIERKSAEAAFNQMLVKSCLYPAMRWNFDLSFTGAMHGRLPPDELKDWQEDADALAVPAPADCPRVVEEKKGTRVFTDHHPVKVPTGPLIIVWLDAGCGSDCEGLTAELSTLPNTWIVGVNSGGVAQFIQPGYGVLPHTGLPFRFALGMSDFYGDNRSFDGHGLDVDLVLAPSEKWSPQQLAELTKLMR